jgi:uncharacterized protein YjbI with pentapeptide repeats
MVCPEQNHSVRLMKRLALPRQKAVDFTKRARGVLKASMKLVQQRWTGSERRKPSTASVHIYEIRPRADRILLKTSLALLLFSLAGYLIWKGYYQGWTGFQGYYNSKGEYVRSKTLWDWMGLLFVPLSLALIAYLFSRQERKIDREIAAEQYQQRLLQDYLDRISKLLLDKELDELKSEGRKTAVARVLTLTVLRQSDVLRRGEILRFLHEAKLIQKEKRIIDLHGAELSGAVLSGLNLEKVDLSGALMERCDLRKAILREANLAGAALSGASLDHANLEGAELINATLNGTTLSHADLREAKVICAKLDGARLDHADLSKATLDMVELSRCSLRRTDLRFSKCGEDVQMSRCDLRGALLQGSSWPPSATVERCRFKGAQYDSKTSWPGRMAAPPDALNLDKLFIERAKQLRRESTSGGEER